MIKTNNGVKIRNGGVYCQGLVTSTAATTRHLNGTLKLGVPVAGHLKGFYKKNRFERKWVRARRENRLKYSQCLITLNSENKIHFSYVHSHEFLTSQLIVHS